MLIATFYARVSTDRDAQQSSIKNQVDFFTEYLVNNKIEKAKNCGVLFRKNGEFEKTDGYYVDEGLTASKSDISNRRAFQQMMKDAKAGKFNIIYTKSISRFSRSLETTVKLIKDLKEIGVGVFFSDLNMNSLEGQNDLLINMFATTAQEESRIKSANIQSVLKKQMEKGKWTASPPYGYNKINGYLEINKEESIIVKDIFKWYLHDGLGVIKIKNLLNEKKITTKRNKAKWNSRTISAILNNPIYTGKMIQHRTMKDDLNRGTIKVLPSNKHIVHEFEHLRIIDDVTFDNLQIEKDKRMEMLGTYEHLTRFRQDTENNETVEEKVKIIKRGNQRHSNAHLFSNLFFCGNCGGTMKRKKTYWKKRNKGNNEMEYTWMCRNTDVYGKETCGYRNSIYESELKEITIDSLKEFINADHSATFKHYLDTRYSITDYDVKRALLERDIADLEDEKSGIFKLYNKNMISESDFQKEYEKINLKIADKTQELNKLLSIFDEIEKVKANYNKFVFAIQSLDINNLTNIMLKGIISGIYIKKIDGDITTDKNDPYYFPNPFVEVKWKFMDTTQEQVTDDLVKMYDKVWYDTLTPEQREEHDKALQEFGEKLIEAGYKP